MRSRAPLVLAFAVAAAIAASAQEPRVQVAAKGGVTVEHSEDALTGTVPALGIGAAASFSRSWRGEFEFWLPGYLEDARGDPKHRDVLFSVAAVRAFGAESMRPFVAFGLSFARTEDWFTFCTANRVPPTGGPAVPAVVSCDEPDVIDIRREKNVGANGYLLTGGGVEIPVTPRVHLVVDVRVNLAPASVLVRPGVGMAVRF